MKQHYILLSTFAAFLFTCSVKAQGPLHYAALHQSVILDAGKSGPSFGTFRTMESLSYDSEKSTLEVSVKIEQPLCEGQTGTIALVNPSGADWTYKVIDKKGSFVAEGAVGYNRRIGELNPGSYFLQFTLPDGTSALDEFSIKQPDGIQASIEKNPSNRYLSASELQFTGISNGASEFVWDFGDGSALVYGQTAVTHTYTKPGNYTISYTVNNFDCQEVAKTEISISGPVAFDKSEY